MSASPPIADLTGFLFMGERIGPVGLGGILLTMTGIGTVILSRSPDEKRMRFNRPGKGLLYAALGAIGQALGLTFSKLGMGTYNPFASTQIRLIAAFVALTIIISLCSRWPVIDPARQARPALGLLC